MNNTLAIRKSIVVLALLTGLFGVVLRFYQINSSDFIFYDEGYYLNFNRAFVEFVDQHHFENLEDWWTGIYTCLKLSLTTGKALWFFIIDSRAFWGWGEMWYFPRMVAAMAGTLTLGMVFLFARRFYSSAWVGYVSVALLALLPSHVFYSRLALQETLSTLFFLAGFYLYLFPGRLNIRTFLSAIVLVGAYFTNYRLIVLPFLIFVTEIYSSLSQKRMPDLRKYVWHTLIFLLGLFAIGSIDGGKNILVTFSWMFHQAQLGQEQFQLFNLLSYPYYIFRLESIPFGLLLLGNIYFLVRKQPFYFYPLILILTQMMVFSLAQDKAARYLCVVTPFMVMAAASFIVFFFQENGNALLKAGLSVLVIWMLIDFTSRSVAFAAFKSDYRPAMEFITAQDKQAKVLSTQSWVHNLYVSDKANVKEAPVEFLQFLNDQVNGFQYLIVDPQAYISFTEDGRKFTPRLKGYLRFITNNIQPIKAYQHFNRPILERFVFEHNENLKHSLQFLNSGDVSLGQLRVYDMKECVAIIDQWLERTKQKASQ